MGKYWGKLRAGCAVAALCSSLPALADTYTAAPGTTQTQAATITDNGQTANTVTIQGGGTEALTSTTNAYTGGTTVIGGSTVAVTADTNLGGTQGALTLGDNTSAGTIDVTGATAAVSSIRSVILDPGGGTILPGSNIWTFSGVVSGGGSLTIGNAATNSGGTLSLAGANTYTGGTFVVGNANLEIASDASLGSTSGQLTLGNATTPGTLTLQNTAAITTTRSVILGAGGATIDTSSTALSPWTFTSAISGTGGLNVGPSGSTGELILDGENTYTGGTNVNGGTLQIGDISSPSASILGNINVNSTSILSGYGTIYGNVVNSSGTVAPAGSTTPLIAGGSLIGNLTVSGSYTQGAAGTLQISVAGLTTTAATGTTIYGTASKLVVGGTAALNGALTLSPSGTLQTGQVTLLTATGGVSGKFTTAPALLNVGFSQQLVYSANAVDLLLTQLKTLAENPSIYPAIKSASIDDAQNANNTILSHLTDTRTGAAVDQMRMAYTDSHGTGRGAGSSPYGAWMKGMGDFGTTSGNGASPSYDQSGGGFIAGLDAQMFPGFVAGAAIGYSKNSVRESGGGTGNISAPRLMVYSGWWLGPIALDATVGYGYSSVTSSRSISQTGAAAVASYGGGELTAAMQASSTFNVGPVVLTPAAGIQYALVQEHSFSESGGGAYNVNGASSRTNSVRPFISATASTRFQAGIHLVIEPMIRVMYQTETSGNSRAVTVAPNGDNYDFTVAGVTPSKNQASVKAGVNFETSRDLAFFTDVARVQGGNTTGTQLDAGVRYRF